MASARTLFFLTGLLFATWASRIPAVQDRIGLDAVELALAVLAIEGGAVVGLPAGGVVATRFGSAAALRLGFAVFAPALAAAVLAPGLGTLAVALAVFAAANSVVDVGLNVQGVELERRAGRPRLTGLHAWHSIGVLAGGTVGTIAAGAGVDVRAHGAAVAAVALGGSVAAGRGLVRESRGGAARDDGPGGAGDDGRRRWAWLPERALLPFAALAFLAFMAEATASQWSAVHMGDERDAAPAVAAAAFTAFALALAASRLAGDRLIARLGRRAVVRGGALVAAVGCGIALLGPGNAAALAGWAVCGAGLAPLAPAILGAAATAGPPAPKAIAAVTTVGYGGSFVAPAIVGAVAAAAGLTLALFLLAAAAILIAVLTHAHIGI